MRSLGTISSCQTAANTRADFTDVFHHRDWILDTMRVTDYFLEGNTRLRSSGRLARGVMGIRCVGIPPVWGPLYVRGVEEGSNCANEELQIVACYLEPGQPWLVISQFVMRTIFSDGTVEIESLPFSPSVASYEGIRPFGAYREFNCTISWPNRDFLPDSGSFFPG